VHVFGAQAHLTRLLLYAIADVNHRPDADCAENENYGDYDQ
jgi:predicted fused transcriptional regulator/phosphomethylpyrimidine kinase